MATRVMKSPWVSLAILWLVTLVLAGLMWQRFTRVPAQPGGLGVRSATSTRRVLPLWLALVLLILFCVAVWLTLRWGAPLWSGDGLGVGSVANMSPM
jgi:ABC-type Fe3+-siderophore transport system permease subunit